MTERFVDSEYFILPALAIFALACVIWGWVYFNKIEPRLRTSIGYRLGVKIFRGHRGWRISGSKTGCRTELMVFVLDLVCTVFVFFGGIFILLALLVLVGLSLRDIQI